MNWKSKFTKKEHPVLKVPEGFHQLSDGRVVSTAQAVEFAREFEENLKAHKPETSRLAKRPIPSIGIPKVDEIP